MIPVTLSEALPSDLPDLLALYRYLHPHDPQPALDEELLRHWEAILGNPALHYVVARSDGSLVSTCALTVILNLTRGTRPYGIIENVVTHPDYRGRGIGTQVLQYALELAWQSDCYKVMLLTGSKQESTLAFYERAGFVRGEKTGFVAKPPQNL